MHTRTVLLSLLACLQGFAQTPLDRVNQVENWPAPLMWLPPPAAHAQPARKGRMRMDAVRNQAAASVVSAPAVFVAITPCRVVDTRSGSAPFGAPAFAAGDIRTFPLPQSTACTIPSSAVAYSLNIAVVPSTSSMRWLTAWDTGSPQPNTATLNDKAGLVTSNAAIIPAGTAGSINVFVTDPTNVVIDINGYYTVAPTAPNTQGVASLKWFPNYVGVTFAVGQQPMAGVFDGRTLWVGNNGDATVSRLRTSDGASAVNQPVAVGSQPGGMAFDGANVWVANSGSGNLTKIRASDATVVGTFAAGTVPAGVAYDGANIWVTNKGNNNVMKLRAADGANLGTFSVGSGPIGVAFDGANIWVVNNGDSTVTELRASDGAKLGTFAVGSGARGAAFDGANLWVTNTNDNTVTKLRASDGANMGTIAVGAGPYWVAFDGANVWVTNSVSNSVTELRASDGATLGTYPVGNSPTGVAFDGANIWVSNSGDNTVSKL